MTAVLKLRRANIRRIAACNLVATRASPVSRRWSLRWRRSGSFHAACSTSSAWLLPLAHARDSSSSYCDSLMEPASRSSVILSKMTSAPPPVAFMTRSISRQWFSNSNLLHDCQSASSMSFRNLTSESPSPKRISLARASASARVAPSIMAARTSSSKFNDAISSRSRPGTVFVGAALVCRCRGLRSYRKKSKNATDNLRLPPLIKHLHPSILPNSQRGSSHSGTRSFRAPDLNQVSHSRHTPGP